MIAAKGGYFGALATAAEVGERRRSVANKTTQFFFKECTVNVLTQMVNDVRLHTAAVDESLVIIVGSDCWNQALLDREFTYSGFDSSNVEEIREEGVLGRLRNIRVVSENCFPPIDRFLNPKEVFAVYVPTFSERLITGTNALPILAYARLCGYIARGTYDTSGGAK